MADLPRVAVQIGFDVAGTPQNIGSDYDALTWTDVTSAVRPDPALTFNRGRPEAGQPAAAGQLQVTLLNDAGDFTPGDNGGTYGAIHTRMPIRVIADAGGYSGEYSTDYAHSEVLWVGFITDIDWLIDGGQPLVTITASDIIAAAARTACGPWLDSRITRATADGLIAYWPLTDPAPNGLGNASTNTVPMLTGETLLSGLSGGGPLTAQGTTGTGTLSVNVPTGGLSPDNQSNAAFTPAVGGGWQLWSPLTITTGEYAVSWWVRMSPRDGLAPSYVWRVIDSDYPLPIAAGGAARVNDNDAEGYFLVSGISNKGLGLSGSAQSGSIAYNTWTHLYTDCDGSTIRLYVNGVLADSDSVAAPDSTTYQFVVSDLSALYSFDGQLAHIAVWDSSDTSRAAILADRGADEPSAADRYDELVYLTANPTGIASWLSTDAQAENPISAQATDSKSLLTLAQEVADAERGSVIATKDGKLALLAQRGTAAAADPLLTLSAESDVLAIDGLFGVDDADNINEARVTLRPSGRVLSATRVTDPGVESTSTDLWSTSEAFAQTLATALANADTQKPRAPSLTLSMDWLAHTGLADEAVTLELGDTITITDLPASAPASSLTVQVRSITHTIARDGWTVRVDTDPPNKLGVLDDTDLGKLDDTLILGV